jgi:hypothetical protein
MNVKAAKIGQFGELILATPTKIPEQKNFLSILLTNRYQFDAKVR